MRQYELGESAACAIFVREERFLKDRPLLKMQEAIKFKAGVVTTEPCGIFNELQYISQEEQQTHAEAKARAAARNTPVKEWLCSGPSARYWLRRICVTFVY